MPASVTGILTLLALVLAGPAAWLVYDWIQRRQRTSKDGKLQQPADAVGKSATKERDEVSGSAYLLGLLGYAIGIGNLWRFPYMVGKWGGGAFILAYVVCLFFVSIPAYLIEMIMGQYTRKSTIDCFKMIHPRWVGLGYAQAWMLFLALGYYNVLLAYATIYLMGSVITPLPWEGNSATYWQSNVLNSYGGKYEGVGLGTVQWKIALAMLFVWLVVFASLVFGKEILAKVTWVTVVGPVIMLFVLLIRALTLEGAPDGVQFYIGKFDAKVLEDINMWAAACGQILFSLSPGFGTAITMSSYTSSKENVFRACMITAFCNSAFSIVGGFAIFSIVGNITFRINAAGGVLDEDTGKMIATTVADQAKAGPGLAFIAIADGMRTFGPGTNAMSVLFFMVLLTLGLDSTFAWAETFVSYVEDFCQNRGYVLKRSQVVAGVCCVFYVCGLFYCTRMGLELLDIVDHYASAYYLLFGVALEAVMFTFDFGWKRLTIHLKLTTLGNSSTPNGQDVIPSLFWRVVIPTTVPVLSLFLFFYTLYHDLGDAYGKYPDWMQAVGWVILASLLLVTPAGGLWQWRWHGTSKLPPLEQDERLLTEALALRQKFPDKPSQFSAVVAPEPIGMLL